MWLSFKLCIPYMYKSYALGITKWSILVPQLESLFPDRIHGHESGFKSSSDGFLLSGISSVDFIYHIPP